mmetsp:Transcript_20838/g.59444  ORF Transcript_20838/g.59444 Transcript_20838/m.59444 type:complete len:83 (+) Transcript_20838:411-659(+)
MLGRLALDAPSFAQQFHCRFASMGMHAEFRSIVHNKATTMMECCLGDCLKHCTGQPSISSWVAIGVNAINRPSCPVSRREMK